MKGRGINKNSTEGRGIKRKGMKGRGINKTSSEGKGINRKETGEKE